MSSLEASNRTPLRTLALLFLGSRAFILLVAAASLPWVAKPAGFNPPATLMDWFLRWDALWYLDIAEHGYRLPAPGAQPNYGFFPLYPWLVRIVSLNGLIDHRLAGYVVSLAAFWIASVLLWRLVARDTGDRRTATWAFAFLCFGPVSFFFSTLYSEACFLALTIGSVHAARSQRWWLAGILGALASSTRLLGIGLILPLLWECIFRTPRLGTVVPANPARRPLVPERASRPTLREWAPCLLPIGGLAAVCGLMWLQFGDPWTYFRAQTEAWGRQFAWFWDLFGRRSFTGLPVPYQVWFASAVVGAFGLLALGVLRRMRVSYTLYALALTFVYISSRFPEALPRYFSGVFPFYIAAGLTATRWPRMGWLMLTLSALLLAASTTVFVNGYWFT